MFQKETRRVRTVKGAFSFTPEEIAPKLAMDY